MMSIALDPEQAETCAIHALVDFTGADVLEVGCGDGRLTWRFAEQARAVLALDPAAAAIATAQAICPAPLRQKVTFQTADITTAALQPAAYDVVVLSWSLC
jgi:2-polyprenyl-3-methyl-5-hydroxy-6-metoxy-1,4-benzoquinol methylase